MAIVLVVTPSPTAPKLVITLVPGAIVGSTGGKAEAIALANVSSAALIHLKDCIESSYEDIDGANHSPSAVVQNRLRILHRTREPVVAWNSPKPRRFHA